MTNKKRRRLRRLPYTENNNNKKKDAVDNTQYTVHVYEFNIDSDIVQGQAQFRR